MFPHENVKMGWNQRRVKVEWKLNEVWVKGKTPNVQRFVFCFFNNPNPLKTLEVTLQQYKK